jgi:hypothetical protein
MILATHQPIFLPWPGFFHKAFHCDHLVLLDEVQFPRGRTWLTSNRLKDEDGELWLTVPVWRTGRGLQRIDRVQIAEERGWRAKHLRGIRQNYAHAPWFADHWPAIEEIYGRGQRRLVDFNLDLIRWLWSLFDPPAALLRQSDLGVHGRATDLMIALCARLGADRLAVLPGVEQHLDAEALGRHGIALARLPYRPVVYPQLWGDFLYNLSALDLVLDCGPRAREIARRGR